MKRQTVRIAIAALLVTALAGCYWTPDQSEGGVSIQINQSELSASQVEVPDAIYSAYVIDADMMRGDPQARDQAFEELDLALEDAFSAFETQDFQTVEELEAFFNNFEINITLPTIRVQGAFFSGTSGTNSFRGLKAGAEYLVVVNAFGTAAETTIDNVGYSTVTIEAGETKTVSLDLTTDWLAFYQYLENNFGYVEPPASVIVDAGVAADADSFSLPSPLYYDFINADAAGGDIDISTYFANGEVGFYVADIIGDTNLSVRIASAPLIDSSGNTIPDPSTGTRPQLPSDGLIEGVLSGIRVRVVIVDAAQRGEIATSPTGDPGAQVVGISDPFTVGLDDPTIDMYSWQNS